MQVLEKVQETPVMVTMDQYQLLMMVVLRRRACCRGPASTPEPRYPDTRHITCRSGSKRAVDAMGRQEVHSARAPIALNINIV